MGGTRWRNFAAAGLALALLSSGCTYSDREAGLFGRTPTPVDRPSEVPSDRPDSAGPIPLLGDAIWLSADPSPVPVRIGVHGLRRVRGGTVLDWSITALSGPDRVPGAAVPGGLSLDFHERDDLALVDRAAARVYRPLVAKGSEVCLCVSVRQAQQDLAYDVPRLLQVAYPTLAADLRTVDVSMALAPVFSRVPVAPLGQVAAPITETDLAAPVEWPVPVARTPDFSLPGGQQVAVEVNAVLASGTLTSVVWTLESLTRGAGPGPGLQPALTRGDRRVRPLRISMPGRDDEVGCLCADPTRWREQLRTPGRWVTVATTLDEVPRGATTVDVEFPGVAPLTDVPVRPASDAALRTAGTVPGPRQTWSTARGAPRRGWDLSSWPTPVPVITKGAFTATVDRILPT